MRRAPLAFLLAILLLGCLSLGAARADGIEPLLRVQVRRILIDLGLLDASGEPASGSTFTDGATIGGGSLASSEILDVTGGATRKSVAITAGGTDGTVTLTGVEGATLRSTGQQGVVIQSDSDSTYFRNDDSVTWEFQNNGHIVPGTDDAFDIGDSSIGVRRVYIGSTGAFIDGGAGSPEGVVTATKGSLYCRDDGGNGTSLYIKTSGSSNTGWRAIADAAP